MGWKICLYSSQLVFISACIHLSLYSSQLVPTCKNHAHAHSMLAMYTHANEHTALYIKCLAIQGHQIVQSQTQKGKLLSIDVKLTIIIV